MEDDFARVLRTMSKGKAPDTWGADARSESVQLDAALHEGAQDRLDAITAALRRFESGTYGDCARCGNPISFGRLSVMPEATFCLACGAM
jgi:DnaK suppressor protein